MTGTANFLDPRSARVAARDMAAYFARIHAPLVAFWCGDYRRTAGASELCEVENDGFFHLFDMAHERLVAAFGVTAGRHGAARDSSRMAGHPASATTGDHKGHAIAHTMGGGLDINLFPQRGALNIGAFRRLERLSIALSPSLYFVRLSYAGDAQRPTRIEQGAMLNDPVEPRLEVETFDN